MSDDFKNIEGLPEGLRFQFICPKCRDFVWASECNIGDQVTCERCNAILTVSAPEDEAGKGRSLHLAVAETATIRSPYSMVAELGLSPESSMTDMFEAFAEDDQSAEALRQLRDPTQRFAEDLLAHPIWGREIAHDEP